MCMCSDLICYVFQLTHLHTPFVTVLDPEGKGKHLQRHWGKELYEEALDRARDIVSSTIIQLYTHMTALSYLNLQCVTGSTRRDISS